MIGHLQLFFAELQRRKVLRIAAAYVVGAWIVLQVAVALQSAIALSSQFSAAILALLVVGFPVVVALAWFFEITPEGVKRTSPAAGGGALVKPQTTDLILAGALGLVVIVAVAQWFIPLATAPAAPTTTTAQTAPAKPELPALGDKSIAVLPFANLSPDKENEYFANGLAEELLDMLSKVPDLKVVSRTSSFAFQGKQTPAPEIARILGVRHIVEGSVRAEGEDLRVTAQLIDVSTDTHLWSETFERKIETVFALQTDIARAIAGALKVEVALADRTAAAPTKGLRAYRLYLQGREVFRARLGPASVQAADLVKEAIELDPAFAEAHALLAASFYGQVGQLRSLEESNRLFALARASAKTALRLKPVQALPYAILGGIDRQAGDWAAALSNGEKAVELEPANSDALLSLGISQLAVGRLSAAANALREARRVDPFYEHVRFWSMLAEYAQGNDKEALAAAQSLSASSSPYARAGHMGLAALAYDRGEHSEAAVHYRKSLPDRWATRPFVDAVVAAFRSGKALDKAVRAIQAEASIDSKFVPEGSLLLLRADDAFIDAMSRRVAAGDFRNWSGISAGWWSLRHKSLLAHPGLKQLQQQIGLVDCPTSAPVRQISRLEEWRISGSS